jgi:predicted nuclease of predicted toxin-antitoxin system
VKFLVDRCAGRRLADWLREQGHDVIEVRQRRPDPGDAAVLQWAVDTSRILVTIDTDFGELIYLRGVRHCGLVRLPDVPARERIALMSEVVTRHQNPLESGAIITVRGGRIRVTTPS